MSLLHMFFSSLPFAFSHCFLTRGLKIRPHFSGHFLFSLSLGPSLGSGSSPGSGSSLGSSLGPGLASVGPGATVDRVRLSGLNSRQSTVWHSTLGNQRSAISSQLQCSAPNIRVSSKQLLQHSTTAANGRPFGCFESQFLPLPLPLPFPLPFLPPVLPFRLPFRD
ncbi:hypothetical protein BDB00DRAFT_440526 [Zychaea mexicana]|uniref:uncharacterized protein n=1 Tax=Zychaea mexicana TaxID=64656 RepID=UPI0022FEE442|nr:uncharacterized protein BDB00DRAFT_440526 [Zychaea mexicana]KAI9492279.1 hypothetical protein BDB00DRAFT_440526 [Zychaea mexicana]